MLRAYFTLNVKEYPSEKRLVEGTILRFLGHEYRKDYQDHAIVFDVLGLPPKEGQADLPKVQFV